MGGFTTVGGELSSAIRINPETGRVEVFGAEGLDMSDKRITNLADPVESSDAVPLRHLNFPSLTDTPSSYEGQGGKIVAVKSTEDGLEFISGGGGGGGAGTTSLWTDTAVSDWPRPEHCTPYDTSTTPMDMVALKWRNERYGSGVAFHSPSDDLPRAAVGVVEYPPQYLRYTALGVTIPSATNPQMPAAYIVSHYYGGTYSGSASHAWYGGGTTGTGKQLLFLDYDYTADKVMLHFGETCSGGHHFLPYADNTGYIGADDKRWARIRARQIVIDTLTQGNFSTAPTTYLGGSAEVLETVSSSTTTYTGTTIKKGADVVASLLTPTSATIATNKNTLTLVPGINLNTGEHAVRIEATRDTAYPEHSGIFIIDGGVYQSEAEIDHLCPEFHRFGAWDSSASSYRYVRVQNNRIYPENDNIWDLGEEGHRWRRVRAVEVVTGDLRLRNERAEWTISEGEDGLYAINNNTGKKYKLKMEEV